MACASDSEVGHSQHLWFVYDDWHMVCYVRDNERFRQYKNAFDLATLSGSALCQSALVNRQANTERIISKTLEIFIFLERDLKTDRTHLNSTHDFIAIQIRL